MFNDLPKHGVRPKFLGLWDLFIHIFIHLFIYLVKMYCGPAMCQAWYQIPVLPVRFISHPLVGGTNNIGFINARDNSRCREIVERANKTG